VWTGNRGDGTARYDCYARSHRIAVAGKPELAGTADVAFRGEPDKHNPEELFLAADAACHMLTYLALCARRGLRVCAYEDEAAATLVVDGGGGGRFETIVLRPAVTVARAEDAALAGALHDEAHRACFIARSCATPNRHEAIVRVEVSR